MLKVSGDVGWRVGRDGGGGVVVGGGVLGPCVGVGVVFVFIGGVADVMGIANLIYIRSFCTTAIFPHTIYQPFLLLIFTPFLRPILSHKHILLRIIQLLLFSI